MESAIVLAPPALLIARLGLAAAFGVAGVAKSADRPGFRRALEGFGAPAGLAAPLVAVLPTLELLTAAALLVPASARLGATAAAAMLAVFTAAMIWNLARGRRPECRCFGRLSAAPIGRGTIVRNGALLALAALVAAFGPGAFGPGLAGVVVALGAAVLVLAWMLVQLLRQQGRMLVRLAALEARSAARSERPARDPKTGAPGTEAPGFSLPSLGRADQSLAELLAPGNPALLVFADPGCKPCAKLLPEIETWHRELGDRLTVAVVSRGSAESNAAKFAPLAARGVPVLLQHADEVADAYGVNGTPMAVLVRADGRIAAPAAERQEGIARLVALAAAAAAEPRPAALGEPAPDVPLAGGSLADLRGREATLLFWNPACAHCERLLPIVQAVAARTAESDAGPALVLVSTGTAAEVAELRRSVATRVLHDEDGTALRRFGAQGTPSAVRLDAEGRVASAVAAGGIAVAEMLGVRASPSAGATAGPA